MSIEEERDNLWRPKRTGNVYNTLALLDTVVEALLWARQ